MYPPFDRFTCDTSYDGNVFYVSYSYIVDNYHIDYDYELSSAVIYNEKFGSY